MPSKVVSRQIKYLETNLTKEVKHLKNANYSTLQKELEDDIRKWKDTSCFYLGKGIGKGFLNRIPVIQ